MKYKKTPIYTWKDKFKWDTLIPKLFLPPKKEKENDFINEKKEKKSLFPHAIGWTSAKIKRLLSNLPTLL